MTSLTWILNLFRRPRRYWYAVRHVQTRAWLVDTCSGGSHDIEFGKSQWWDTPIEAVEALTAAEIPVNDHVLVRLTVQPQTNHYKMKEIPWCS